MKRNDITVAAVVLASALLSAGAIKLLQPKSSGSTVTVKQDNEVVYSGPLSKDHTVKLDGNTVNISGGKAEVVEADCRNQICVRHKAIERIGETVICLPNRVIVQIE